MTLFTGVEAARANLANREDALREVLGERWTRSVDAFKAWLSDADSTQVRMYLTEYNEMYDDVDSLIEYVRDCIGAFDVPYLTGKKALFTRRPKVSEQWKELLWPINHYSKEAEGHNAWVIFGAPHHTGFDPR